MIDDVLGLLVLAVISGIIQGVATGVDLGGADILLIVAKALVFLAAALGAGSFLSPRLFRRALALRSTGVVQALALSFCFGLSALALLAWTIQPEPPKYTTPLTPTLFIYPEPEDIDSLRFS